MAGVEIHKNAVAVPLFDLLIALMEDSELREFKLVGGTALALLFGHRRSVDIDLFTNESFNARGIACHLEHEYGLMQYSAEKNSVTGSIGMIKVDLIAHRYPAIDEIIESHRIRMMGVKDLAAMKLNAIANRGSKKDFWDCAALIERYPLTDQISWYEQKYPQANLWQLEKSLAYFDDAELEPDPDIFDCRSWEQVKSAISQAVARLPV